MKDRQMNTTAVAIEQSSFYDNKATHKQETKFVSKEKEYKMDKFIAVEKHIETRQTYTPAEWGKGYARANTCIYAEHDTVQGQVDYCAICDWPLPDGCMSCPGYVSACVFALGTLCELRCVQLDDDTCINCHYFEKPKQEVK